MSSFAQLHLRWDYLMKLKLLSLILIRWEGCWVAVRLEWVERFVDPVQGSCYQKKNKLNQSIDHSTCRIKFSSKLDELSYVGASISCLACEFISTNAMGNMPIVSPSIRPSAQF